jgi:hypothetical protein
MPRLRRCLNRLHRDEEGASMVFAAITFFTLAIAIMFVFQVSLVSTDRIQIQNAADAAAYSGALVEANSLNAVGQVNDAMAFIHYNLLRYTVDSIVYRTLEDFKRHDEWANTQLKAVPAVPLVFTSDPEELGQEPADAPDEVMLGDAGDWAKNLDRVSKNEDLIKSGAKWLTDLHHVGRLIVAATPRLVREAVIDVARRNGATHVAISRDLDLAFRVDKAGAGFKSLGDTKTDGAGPNGGQMGGSSLAAQQSVWRYALEELAVDGKPQQYPSWFDAFEGATGSPYSQARVCWDPMDWAHGPNNKGERHMLRDGWQGGMYPPRPGVDDGGRTGDAPNGHWHAQHIHPLMPAQIPGPPPLPYQLHNETEGGTEPMMFPPRERLAMSGQNSGGHYKDDMILHGEMPKPDYVHAPVFPPTARTQDHAVIRCPTYYAYTRIDLRNYGRAAGQGSDYATVVVNSDRPQQRRTHRPPQQKRTHFRLEFESQLPRPLGITQELLRSGITVVTYRPGDELSTLLPASPWGSVAVASAQVGLMVSDQADGGPVQLLKGFEGKGQDLAAAFASPDQTNDDKPTEGPRLGLAEEIRQPPNTHEDPTFAQQGQTNFRNLYYHHELAKGIRFGARLVPVARLHSWHSELVRDAQGLDELIGARIDETRWFTVDDAFNPTNEVPEIGDLHGFLSVTGPSSLEEAMWH